MELQFTRYDCELFYASRTYGYAKDWWSLEGHCYVPKEGLAPYHVPNVRFIISGVWKFAYRDGVEEIVRRGEGSESYRRCPIDEFVCMEEGVYVCLMPQVKFQYLGREVHDMKRGDVLNVTPGATPKYVYVADGTIRIGGQELVADDVAKSSNPFTIRCTEDSLICIVWADEMP